MKTEGYALITHVEIKDGYAPSCGMCWPCWQYKLRDVRATHAHLIHSRPFKNVMLCCDECIPRFGVHPQVCPYPCKELLEEANRPCQRILDAKNKETNMMLFYLDIESETKDMQSLTAISKALSRVQEDLQKKIRNGYDKKSCNGNVVDSSGNACGEWDAVFDQ